MVDIEIISESAKELIVHCLHEPIVVITFRADNTYTRSDLNEWRQWRLIEDGTVQWWSGLSSKWQPFDDDHNEQWALIVKNWLSDYIILEDI